jgi:16S rRNA C1402 N4-methylase RsmH
LETKNLVEITHWTHVTLAEVLTPGDLAVDLTVGNGKDALFLFNIVGIQGCVVGFDIQLEALQGTMSLLENVGADVKLHTEGAITGVPTPGVQLILADHARWADFVHGSPKAVIANLGYLPGGDHEIVTRAPTTEAALKAAMDKLAPGGRLAVVCYIEHPGGREEAEAVENLFSEQAGNRFQVLRIDNPLAATSPFLLVAEKNREA